MMGVGAALFLGFLLAICVVVFALISGIQGDVGYAPFEDVGTDTVNCDDGYDSDPTWMTGESIGVIVNKKGIIPLTSFRG